MNGQTQAVRTVYGNPGQVGKTVVAPCILQRTENSPTVRLARLSANLGGEFIYLSDEDRSSQPGKLTVFDIFHAVR